MNRGLLTAAAALVVANGLILVNVARNRAGNPDAVVRLTERELHSYVPADDESETLLEFRIQWQMAPGPDDSTSWFDRARLETLGAEGLPPVGDTTWTRAFPVSTRNGYVVLELAGPAWERWQARAQARRDSIRAANAPDTVAAPLAGGHQHGPPVHEPEGARASRLMAVDVGLDPLALRERYPDRSMYLILPATWQADITLSERDSTGQVTRPTTVTGRIAELLPGTVHVPRPLRDSLLGLGAALNDSTTHFEVTYKVGRRWEGWVE